MWHSRRNTWDLDCWLEGWLWPMVTESLYSPQNLHICSQIFCTAALLILKETVLIGDPESYPLNNSKSRACLCRLWVWLCWGVVWWCGADIICPGIIIIRLGCFPPPTAPRSWTTAGCQPMGSLAQARFLTSLCTWGRTESTSPPDTVKNSPEIFPEYHLMLEALRWASSVEPHQLYFDLNDQAEHDTAIRGSPP